MSLDTDRSLTEHEFAVFDFETTGLNPTFGHRACEIAIQVLSLEEQNDGLNYTIQEEFQSLIDPERSISPGAQNVNGITREMLQGTPRFPDLADVIHDLLNNKVIVAHNARFDIEFLRSELDQANREMIQSEVVDTCKIARKCFQFSSNSLGNIADELDLGTPNHRSLADVRVTSKALVHFLNELREEGVETLSELVQRQGGPISLEEDYTEQLQLPDRLSQALENDKQVKINYVSSNGNKTTRTITPLRPTDEYGRAYLVAYCHMRDEQRTFRVDRIEDMDVVSTD